MNIGDSVARALPAPIPSLLAALLLLGGCAGVPTPVPGSAPEATRPSPGTATAPVTPRSESSDPVSPVDRLLREAADACTAGDIAAGLARLDRALRIAPQRAGLYLEMARCHAGAGDDDRAAAAAERGLSYCRGEDCERLRRFIAA